MAFILRLFQSQKKQRDYPNIKSGVDPLETWRKVGELGDGAFGKVFKVSGCVTCSCGSCLWSVAPGWRGCH